MTDRHCHVSPSGLKSSAFPMALLLSASAVRLAPPAAAAPRRRVASAAPVRALSAGLRACTLRTPAPARRSLVARAEEGAGEAAAEADGEEEAEAPAPRERFTARGGGGKDGPQQGRRPFAPKEKPEFDERVVQVSRVTKVVKGGKQLSFRAVVVIGNKEGRVGVGVAKAKEVIIAVQKAVTDAKKTLIEVPITSNSSVPHKMTLKGCGSSQVMIRPALPGSGITAGGAVRAVLELAGYKNVNAKMLAGTNPLNNGRVALKALEMMRTPADVAGDRDLTPEEVRKPTLSAHSATVLLRPRFERQWQRVLWLALGVARACRETLSLNAAFLTLRARPADVHAHSLCARRAHAAVSGGGVAPRAAAARSSLCAGGRVAFWLRCVELFSNCSFV